MTKPKPAARKAAGRSPKKRKVRRDPAQSYRSIAKKANVDKNVVTRERERLEDGGALHHQETRIGSDGVAQPQRNELAESLERTIDAWMPEAVIKPIAEAIGMTKDSRPEAYEKLVRLIAVSQSVIRTRSSRPRSEEIKRLEGLIKLHDKALSAIDALHRAWVINLIDAPTMRLKTMFDPGSFPWDVESALANATSDIGRFRGAARSMVETHAREPAHRPTTHRDIAVAMFQDLGQREGWNVTLDAINTFCRAVQPEQETDAVEIVSNLRRKKKASQR